MIDSAVEQLIPLSLAAREIPNRRGGRGINTCTIWRWCVKGCRGIRLETLCVGALRMTSREAVARFIERSTAAADGTPVPSRTPAARERAIAAAERELEEAGI